jgi:hypothetical protein
MRVPYLVLMLLIAGIASAQGQTKIMTPGETIPISAAGLNPTDEITVTLTPLPPVTTAAECKSGEANVVVDGPGKTSFSLGIPPTLCPGRYQLTAQRQAAAESGKTQPPPDKINPSPEYLQVNEPPPTITGIYPRALYRDSPSPYSLVFLGPNSVKANEDYTLRITDHSLPKCDEKSLPANGQSCFQQDKETTQDGQIKFVLRGNAILSQLSGKQSVYLVHHEAESAQQQVTFVNANRTTPRNYAIGLTVALAILIYFLLSTARKVLPARPDRGTFLLSALFLDEETKTYSLSKCQFYAWTFAAILSYVFLAVARSIIQGNAVFPDIPGGLPGIILFSAGTSVVATGITSSKGSKGSGEVHPTLADFITNGGVVAPERLQFVVWTVVGIFTFLTIVFKSDPLVLSDLPSIPDRFLQLMGISAAGYLAGKLVRKPGPVAKNISVANVTPAGGNLPNQYQQPSGTALQFPVVTLNLKGENLDPNGQIKVDGQPLRGDMFWINHDVPDPQSGFCNELNVSLNDASAYLEGTHTLTLVNADAQAADFVFPVDPMTIDSIQETANPPGQAPDVAVTGSNFVTGTTAEWRDAQGQPVPNFSPITVPPPITAKNLTVPRPAAAVPGSSFKLILVSPIGLRVSKKV